MTERIEGERVVAQPQAAQSKMAAYVVGDHNIFFPALVALTSLANHNPNRFDLFISFDGVNLTPAMAAICERNGVNFIDAKTIPHFEEAGSLTVMREAKWPVEVHLNWCLPEYLDSLGYSHSLKLDYDVLCINPLGDVSEYVSGEVLMAMLKTKVDTTIDAKALARIRNEVGYSSPRKFSINAGIAFINNRRCAEMGFFNKYVAIYRILDETAPDTGTAEQAALALIASNFEAEFVRLETKHHQRIIRLFEVEDFRTSVSLVHYMTGYKPWRPIKFGQIANTARRDWALLHFYRNVWLEAAMKLECFADFCSERPLDHLAVLALANAVIHGDRKALKSRIKTGTQKRNWMHTVRWIGKRLKRNTQ